ncbi:MAG: hypothetical protein Ct9H300mP32_4140 [Verrucomicrobiota bacterium]|nr:MAG: hypothetical protein Ct9H300mP32_4140 [Verrucomicrobiota bacterium]
MKKKGGQVVIDNDPSLKLLARKAVSHAEAGADVVAPSDMMEVAWRRFARRSIWVVRGTRLCLTRPSLPRPTTGLS